MVITSKALNYMVLVQDERITAHIAPRPFAQRMGQCAVYLLISLCLLAVLSLLTYLPLYFSMQTCLGTCAPPPQVCTYFSHASGTQAIAQSQAKGC